MHQKIDLPFELRNQRGETRLGREKKDCRTASEKNRTSGVSISGCAKETPEVPSKRERRRASAKRNDHAPRVALHADLVMIARLSVALARARAVPLAA